MGSNSSINIIHSSITKNIENRSNEVIVMSISDSISCLIIEKGNDTTSSYNSVDNEFNQKEHFFFKGWMVNHDKEAIVLGPKGFKNFHISHEGESLTSSPIDAEGSFVLASWDKEKLLIQNDLFNLFPILYFSTPDLIVASDSLFVLTKIRKALSLTCELNEKVVHSRAWTHGLSCALMSSNTMVKGIKLLTPGSYITAQIQDFERPKKIFSKSLSIRKIQRPIKSLFTCDNLSYEEALNEGIKQLCGSISAIMNLDEVRVKFGLSGGLDSRLLLALLLKNPQWMDKVDIISSTHSSRSRDYEIVNELASKYNFQFNQKDQSFEKQKEAGARPLRINNSFGLWVLASMGIFDMMYFYRSYWSNPVVIEMGGHGAEIVKGTFSTMELDDILYTKPRKRYKSISKEVKTSLKELGIKSDEEAPLQWHHLCFKSAIQNGRFVDRTNLALRPFLNGLLYSLARSDINPFRQHVDGEPTLLHDMLIMLNPDLSTHQFENPKYNLTKEYVDHRIKELSINTDNEISPYHIFGSVMDIINGPLDAFMAMVSEYDFQDQDQKKATLELLEKQWSKIVGTNLEQIFQSAYDLAITRLQDPEFYSPSAGTPAAKIISLSLLDNN
jgi:hypothetical protein